MKRFLCAIGVALVATGCVIRDPCPYDESLFSPPSKAEVADSARKAALGEEGAASKTTGAIIGAAGAVAEEFADKSELRKCLEIRCDQPCNNEAACLAKVSQCKAEQTSLAQQGYYLGKARAFGSVFGLNVFGWILVLLAIAYLAYRKPIPLEKWEGMSKRQRIWQSSNLALVALAIAFALNIPALLGVPSWLTWLVNLAALAGFAGFLYKRFRPVLTPSALAQPEPKASVCPLCGGPDCVKFCVQGHGLLPQYQEQKAPEDGGSDEDVIV